MTLVDNSIIKIFGWRATLLWCDPCVSDRWKWIRRRLQPGPLRTLDAGCGSGTFTLYAAKIGNAAVGLSFDAANNDKARRRATVLGLRNVQFIDADLRRLDEIAEELGTFDQIICCETIEHIIDDRRLLANLSALLRPGGRLLLTTPSREHRRYVGEKLSEREDGGHVRWGYSHGEMRVLLEKSGLLTFSEDEISGIVTQQLNNLSHLLSEVSRYATLLTLPFRLFQSVDVPITKAIGYPFLSIGIVATKPSPMAAAVSQ